jgi:hypothetical protein
MVGAEKRASDGRRWGPPHLRTGHRVGAFPHGHRALIVGERFAVAGADLWRREAGGQPQTLGLRRRHHAHQQQDRRERDQTAPERDEHSSAVNNHGRPKCRK